MRPLTPERWQRLAPIIDEAWELEPEARAGYLDLVCAQDPSLRADAEALLAADALATSSDFLEASAETYIGFTPAGGSLPPGSRLGPYRIVRELGHGGMGAVHLGERADGQFEQSCATPIRTW